MCSRSTSRPPKSRRSSNCCLRAFGRSGLERVVNPFCPLMQMNAAAKDFGRRRKMKLPIQISFHNLERIEAVENRILEEAARLDEFCDRIMSCRVVIDVAHRHHLVGNVYQVRIDIKVPGEEIAIV